MLTGRPHQFSRSRIVSHISLPLGAAETDIHTWLTVVLSKVKLKKCIKIICLNSHTSNDPTGFDLPQWMQSSKKNTRYELLPQSDRVVLRYAEAQR